MARAFICGCSGYNLTSEERDFFTKTDPWGLVLFARNCNDPGQIKNLISDFRESVGRQDAAVLIDQEGGRVQRLGPPHWPSYPAASQFGALYRQDPIAGLEMAELAGFCIGSDLARLGINVDCIPVVDVPVAGAHDIIGDRAYSADPNIVAELGRAVAMGALKAGVIPVVKHIPGHGRARADSHMELPIVETSADQLIKSDFVPFKALNDLPVAMTAHVIYTAYDAENPATLSANVITQVIRGQIGFDGLLISDDLSMHALSGAFEDRAMCALEAGCDIALHCNGEMAEMRAIAEICPVLDGKALIRADKALKSHAGGGQLADEKNRLKLLSWAQESNRIS